MTPLQQAEQALDKWDQFLKIQPSASSDIGDVQIESIRAFVAASLSTPSALAAIRAYRESREAGAWRLIESAPKDGTVFIVPGGIAHYYEGVLYTLTGEAYPGRPIQWECWQWMPMPRPTSPPPAPEGGGK